MQHHGMPLRHHCVPTLLCSKYSTVIGFWPRGKRGRVDHQNTCQIVRNQLSDLMAELLNLHLFHNMLLVNVR